MAALALNKSAAMGLKSDSIEGLMKLKRQEPNPEEPAETSARKTRRLRKVITAD